MNIDNPIDEQPRVASVKLRLKTLKDPKLEIFHNNLEDRIMSMDNIHKTIDAYEELSGYQWEGKNYVFVIWNDENPNNAVFSGEMTGLDHPEMLGDYIKAILNTTNRTEL